MRFQGRANDLKRHYSVTMASSIADADPFEGGPR